MKNRMNLLPFVFRFALVGGIVPILLNVVWRVINNASSHNLSFEIVMEKITLLLWPSSVALLAGAGFNNNAMSIKLFFLATVMNVVLYSVLGASVWYVIGKSRILLLLPITAVGALWYWLLRL
jgi:hypothetical protein